MIKYQSIKACTTACKFIYQWKMKFSMIEAESGWRLIVDSERCDDNVEVKGGSMKLSIDDFIDVYGKTQACKIISTGNDSHGLKKVYDNYMQNIKKAIEDKNIDELAQEEDWLVYEEIESYILMRLHDKLFINSPSEKDKELQKRLISLSWINLSKFGIDEELRSYIFWEAAANSNVYIIYRIEDYDPM